MIFIYCTKCGAENKDDAIFCSKCGKEINDKAEIRVGNDVRVSPFQKKPSNWWYLLPIFLGLMGGIIGYFALRNKNKVMAKNVLIVGLVVVPAAMAVSFLLFGLTRPMVIMESGSMIPHMDISNIILVESPDRKEVITYMEGKQSNYTSFDDYGDVILYRPNGREEVTPIIHRAMYYVETGEPMWGGGPPAPHAGYITKGDNSKTNPSFDQQGSISNMQPVKKEWVIGAARFIRVPVLGCISLMPGGNLACLKV